MPGVVLKINQIVEDLPISERKVGRYVSENLSGMVGVSVEELARRSGSSQATNVRITEPVEDVILERDRVIVTGTITVTVRRA